MSAHHVARRLERRGVGRTWPVGGRVFLAYPDEVGEGVIVERGMGDYVRKRVPHDPYVVRVTVGTDRGSEGPMPGSMIFSDPLAASIESARLAAKIAEGS